MIGVQKFEPGHRWPVSFSWDWLYLQTKRRRAWVECFFSGIYGSCTLLCVSCFSLPRCSNASNLPRPRDGKRNMKPRESGIKTETDRTFLARALWGELMRKYLQVNAPWSDFFAADAPLVSVKGRGRNGCINHESSQDLSLGPSATTTDPFRLQSAPQSSKTAIFLLKNRST